MWMTRLFWYEGPSRTGGQKAIDQVRIFTASARGERHRVQTRRVSWRKGSLAQHGPAEENATSQEPGEQVPTSFCGPKHQEMLHLYFLSLQQQLGLQKREDLPLRTGEA